MTEGTMAKCGVQSLQWMKMLAEENKGRGRREEAQRSNMPTRRLEDASP